MLSLVEVVLPVFLVIGLGYVAVWLGLFSDKMVEGLMTFTQTFAIPFLLFRAIADLDIASSFQPLLLGSFYAGALICFLLGYIGSRYAFGRDAETSVAVGFCCLFSNSLLLGLPITEQAFGSDSLAANYAIISLHSPVCYAIGITVMEMTRNRGNGRIATAKKVIRGITHNALLIGIAAGFVVNLSGVTMPGPVTEAVDLIARSALPAALFGLGGVLVRYSPRGDLKIVGFICAVSLVLHPAMTWYLATWGGLGVDGLRSAVVTAAMAPGVNAYIFANIYGAGRKSAAAAVLIATAASVLTATLWLAILP